MYKEWSNKNTYNKIEEDILAVWEKENIFIKSIHEKGPNFVFYDGPPTANGKPGIHHVMSRTIKDTITRYKNLQGFRVLRKAGWDTHGLPVEIQVEKELGIEGRDQIVKFGLSEFNSKCKESVFTYKDFWDKTTKRMAYWVDLENPYITCDNNYIESVWWILNQLYKKELIYKGYKIQPYCPKCGTSLSSHEVSQGYKDVKDLTATVKFELKAEKNTFILAWTTTPWTLPSNMALAVGSEIEYVKIKMEASEEKFILAKDLLAIIETKYEIVENLKGSDLKGLAYVPLFNFVKGNENSHKVVLGDFVTTSDGTGVVHMAPAYGEDDYKTCLSNNIPIEIIVKNNGTFDNNAGEFAGLDIKIADPEIVTNLKKRGLLFKSQKLEHSYPHCWRHGTPLFYYATDSWFIKTTKYRDALIKNNKTINWYPPEVGEGRFGKWLENNIDWSLSRNRYWGTPLNIWVSEDSKETKSIGSIDELKTEINLAIKAGFMKESPSNLDLHKPYVDDIFLVSNSGQKMIRTPEVIDCWFDSGAMPLAQYHYPFENKELIDSGNAYPADFICEGIDQTRGWFYTLLAISTMLFDKTPYKNVIVNNLILDKDGQKMSKSKGNTVDPQAIIEKYGVDSLRWYLVASSNPWLAKRFDEDGIVEIQRKFVGTLINTYSFFALYANVDHYDSNDKAIPIKERPEIDKWIISLLYSKIKEVTNFFDSYDITSAARVLNDFLLDDVSNWYVRRNRRRFWKGEMNSDKLAAYQTLEEVLMALIKMASPIMPFLTEWIYQNLKKSSDPQSIHMAFFPKVNKEAEQWIDQSIENKMAIAQKIVEMARSLRSEHQLKIRQPLAKILVYVESDLDKQSIKQLNEIITEELNIKSLELASNADELALRKPKANFKVIGPKFGKIANIVAERIKNLNSVEFNLLENKKTITEIIQGQEVQLNDSLFDIVHEKREGLVVASAEGVTVALDTILTEELIKECMAREFVSRVQNVRKDLDFDVVDRICIDIQSTEKFKIAINSQLNYIQTETLAESINFIPTIDNGIELNVEGEIVNVKVRKNN